MEEIYCQIFPKCGGINTLILKLLLEFILPEIHFAGQMTVSNSRFTPLLLNNFSRKGLIIFLSMQITEKHSVRPFFSARLLLAWAIVMWPLYFLQGYFPKEKFSDRNRATAKTGSSLSHPWIPRSPLTYQIFNHRMLKYQSNFITDDFFNMKRDQVLIRKKDVNFGRKDQQVEAMILIKGKKHKILQNKVMFLCILFYVLV